MESSGVNIIGVPIKVRLVVQTVSAAIAIWESMSWTPSGCR